jgi:hypothetical protein
LKITGISHHGISVRLIAVLLIVVACGVSIAVYSWQTLTIPIEIKEPIEVLSYPSQLSLYPGETQYFNVTIKNQASVKYSVALVIHLGNATYESKYVTFDNEIYTVSLGQQNLTTWLKVGSDAISTRDSLIVEIIRLTNAENGTEQLTISKITWTWGAPGSRSFTIYVNNTGTKDATINQVLVNYGTSGVTEPTSLPYILKTTKWVSLTVKYDYNNGTNYDISVVTTDGYKFTNIFQGGTNSG